MCQRQHEAVEVAEVGMNISDIEYEEVAPAARLTPRADEMPWLQGLQSVWEDGRTRQAQGMGCLLAEHAAGAEIDVLFVARMGKQLAESYQL